MDSQFSKEGSRKRERMQERLKDAKAYLDDQKAKIATEPSYKLDRAISSVKYYERQIQQLAIREQSTIAVIEDEYKRIAETKIAKLKKENEQYLNTLNESLEIAKNHLEGESSKKPSCLVVAERRYNRVLEEYIKLGFETEKEKLARLANPILQTKAVGQPEVLPTQPALEITPVVCAKQVAGDGSNFVKPDLEIPLTKPIPRTIELSETISKPLPPDFDTIGEDVALLSLRKLHNPTSKAFKPNLEIPLPYLPIPRTIELSETPLPPDERSDDEPTQEEIDAAARKVRESYRKTQYSTPTNLLESRPLTKPVTNPQIPLTQMVRLSSSGKPMKSVKVALAR